MGRGRISLTSIFYRIDTPRELETLGQDDLRSEKDSVLLIEWGERFRDFLRTPRPCPLRRGIPCRVVLTALPRGLWPVLWCRPGVRKSPALAATIAVGAGNNRSG